ncbi:cysteine-rich receptor-like protein kinase 25 [Morus notabilis]|uniref:cysteine-rich receptor-like protein kinase 25 n=1 Tax=Morus notabilis TaxID=981085 RepID=UPI000CED5B80|nr:cysteine-rich receptor-like protein kinase 25 [Morus notabilis]
MVIAVLLSFLSLIREAAALEYRYHICSNTTTFPPNSTYQFNLNRLLSSLASNATLNTGYYNVTVGRDPTSTVYGSLLCRGDVTPDDCQNCAETAISDIAEPACPVEKEAAIWYDKCTLRYSNKSFFGVLDQKTWCMCNTKNATDPGRFTPLLESTMKDLVSAAVGAPSGEKKFATKKESLSTSQTLYSLVQCTPDLSSSNCDRCLQGNVVLLPKCCVGKQGGNIFNPSCNIRYEVYPFYRITVSAPNPAPVISSRGNNKFSTTTIVAICAPISVAILFLIPIGVCYWLKKRSRDEKNVVQNDQNAGNEITTVESLQFDLSTIRAATDNFSDDNKLGEGGFGAVYKGQLSDGQEISELDCLFSSFLFKPIFLEKRKLSIVNN